MKIMITAQTKKLIEENPIALATVNQDGSPHCSVVAYAKVVADNQIVVTDNYLHITNENIKNNNKVTCVVWNKEWQQDCCGFRLSGEAQYFDNGKWYEFVKDLAENEGEPCKGAVLITVKEIKKLA